MYKYAYTIFLKFDRSSVNLKTIFFQIWTDFLKNLIIAFEIWIVFFVKFGFFLHFNVFLNLDNFSTKPWSSLGPV